MQCMQKEVILTLIKTHEQYALFFYIYDYLSQEAYGGIVRKNEKKS